MRTTLPSSARVALTVGKVVFWVVAAFEAWLLFGIAYYSLNPDAVDLLDEIDDSPDIFAAAGLASLAVVFGLGVIAACLPRLPMRTAVTAVAALTVVVANLVGLGITLW